MDVCPECEGNLIHKPFDTCECCQIIGSYHQYEIFNPKQGGLSDNLINAEMRRCNLELKKFKKTLTNRSIFILNLWYWQGLDEKEIDGLCIV